MGRQAKYHTLLERSLAKASRDAHFNHTQVGRLLRQSQNRAAYLRRKARPFKINIPDLPASTVAYAKLSLRATDLFDVAYQRSITKHQFNLGLDIAPYNQLPILCPLCPISDADALDLQHTINGEQLHALEVCGRKRYAELVNTEIFEESTQRLSKEVDDRLAHWLQLEGRGGQFKDCPRAGLLYDLSLEWGARILYVLRDELEERRSGLAEFRQVFKEKKLAWQNICIYR